MPPSVTLPTAALAVAGAGAATSAVGTITGGIAQKEQADYQAQVARNNQTIALQNANYASEAGAVQAENVGLKAAGELGQVKAAQAAGGIDVNSGSAVDVQQSQRESGALSELTTANNATLQAYGYQTQATGYAAQAGLEEATAENAIPGSLLSAAGGALSSAGTLGFRSAASTLPDKFAWMAQYDDS